MRKLPLEMSKDDYLRGKVFRIVQRPCDRFQKITHIPIAQNFLVIGIYNFPNENS
jgi:hypothetical protein